MNQGDIGDENDQPINDETDNDRLKEFLLRLIAEDEYIPTDCRDPEHDESEIASALTGNNLIYYEKANNDDDDACQYYIANSFRKGINQFPVDKAISFKYMKKAASHGNKFAIYGLSYLMNPNFENLDDVEGAQSFVKMLKIATYFDSEEASYMLGFLYNIGSYVEKNYLISLIYLKFSADKQYPPAMLMLANSLRRIANGIITSNEIEQMKIKTMAFLNDQTGINEINNKLRMTAISVFNDIDNPQIADTTSRVYYQNVIDNEESSEQQKNTAQNRLATLEDDENN